MKFKTTAKQMRDNYHNAVRIGYCEAQTLLSDYEPMQYPNERGWKDINI